MASSTLSQFLLFRDVPIADIASFSPLLIEKSYARREVVISRGEAGLGLGFVLDGRLQGVDFTLDGREVGLFFVAPGQFFGELSVVDGAPAAEYVIALGKAQVVFLPQEHARKLIFSVPKVAETIMHRLAERVRAGSEQRVLLSLPNPFQRLCASLLQLLPPGEQTIVHAPTHQELAIMINSSRETVTRAFQSLQNQSIVQRDGSNLLILKADKLRTMAEGME